MTSYSVQDQQWPVWARASFLAALAGLSLGLTLVISGCYTAETKNTAPTEAQTGDDANAANLKGKH